MQNYGYSPASELMLIPAVSFMLCVCERFVHSRYCYYDCVQVDLPATSPRVSRIEFQFLPELGDYKTINNETYLNPWINYKLPNPILVSCAVSMTETCVFALLFLLKQW